MIKYRCPTTNNINPTSVDIVLRPFHGSPYQVVDGEHRMWHQRDVLSHRLRNLQRNMFAWETGN